MVLIKNSTNIPIEPWFIPFDTTIIVCTILVIILSILYLFIIIVDKTCHTVPMMLIANSCLAELILACDICAMGIFSLQNDLKKNQYQDSLCVFRGYLGYVACTSLNYSYLLLSIYRYITIVYPSCMFWRSARVQIMLISLSWIFSFACAFPYLFAGDIIYNVDNQICQIPLRFSFPIVFGTLYAYMIPVMMIMFIYLKLVRYVKGMNKCITPANILLRVRRELKMVRRIVTLVTVVVTFGVPYALTIFLSFFNRAPRYHFRIILMLTNVPLMFVMIALFHITDPLKTSIMKTIKRARRQNVIIARAI